MLKMLATVSAAVTCSVSAVKTNFYGEEQNKMQVEDDQNNMNSMNLPSGQGICVGCDPSVNNNVNNVSQSEVEVEEQTQSVGAYSVSAGPQGIDYRKVLEQFGCSEVDEAVVDRILHSIRRVTGKEITQVHHYLRRNIYYAHRDLDVILEKYEQGIPFYLYTGRGPSSDALHLGHLTPFIFNKWLQETFDVPLLIQITDDEKFWAKDFHADTNKAQQISHDLAIQNIKDIMALGFDKTKTFIFIDSDYIQYMYPTAMKIAKHINQGTASKAFGFDESTNTGLYWYINLQAAPSFPSTFPTIFGSNPDKISCVIPCAIDQDPFFRLTRDVAHKLNFPKPATFYSSFFPGLKGHNSKMSSSDPDYEQSTIFITDSRESISKKVHKHAFSGGRETKEEHRKNGANLDIDVPYSWLRFLMEDDEEFARIGEEYKSGRMLTGEIKNILVDEIMKVLEPIQAMRKTITDEDVEEIMNPILEERKSGWRYSYHLKNGGNSSTAAHMKQLDRIKRERKALVNVKNGGGNTNSSNGNNGSFEGSSSPMELESYDPLPGYLSTHDSELGAMAFQNFLKQNGGQQAFLSGGRKQYYDESELQERVAESMQQLTKNLANVSLNGTNATNSSSNSSSSKALSKPRQRNALVDSTGLLVKGGLCNLLHIPFGYSTTKFQSKVNSNKGVITVKVGELPNASELNGETHSEKLLKTFGYESTFLNKEYLEKQRNMLQSIVNDRLNDPNPENKKFNFYTIDRALAEENYGKTSVYESRVPASVKTLRLSYIKGFGCNCAGPTNIILKSLDSVSSLEITTFKYKVNVNNKDSTTNSDILLEVGFTVEGDDSDENCHDGKDDVFEQPRLEDLLPRNSLEVRQKLGGSQNMAM